jgi:hypothetical protein
LIPRKLTHEKELRLQETKGKERIEKLTGEQMSPLDKSEQGREKLPLFARFFHEESPTLKKPQCVIFLLTLLLLVSVVFFAVRRGSERASEPGAFRTR